MADATWRVMEGVVVAVLLVVVMEIGVMELLVVGFGGLRLLELLLLRVTGDPLHVTALGFRLLWRSVQQPCRWIRKLWWGAKGAEGYAFPREDNFKAGTAVVALPKTPFLLPLITFPSGHTSPRDPRWFLWDDSLARHVLDRDGLSAVCPHSTWLYSNLGNSLPAPPATNLLLT